MEIHCSQCDRVESISSADLIPKHPPLDQSLDELIPEEDQGNIRPGAGLPYEMEELARVIKEQLPAWEVGIENAHGTKSLEIVCSNHFISQNLHDLVADFKAAKEENSSLKALSDSEGKLRIQILELYEEHGYVKIRKSLDFVHKNINELL